MPPSTGQFVWYDLATSDLEAASRFYCAVIGWTASDSGMPGPPYLILRMGETMVGGLFGLPPTAEAAGARPRWSGYVTCEDVDAACPRLTDAGGKVFRAPEDIPGVGRFAVVGDAQGAAFILFAPSQPPTTPPNRHGAPGHVGWHELHTGDLDSAWRFYEGLFSWTKGDVHDLGPMGPYQIFSTSQEGLPVGGMVGKSAEMPHAAWLIYFTVPAIEAAVGRVKAGGGTLLNGPMQVPGGVWIAHCVDPQGVMFALTSPAH